MVLIRYYLQTRSMLCATTGNLLLVNNTHMNPAKPHNGF